MADVKHWSKKRNSGTLADVSLSLISCSPSPPPSPANNSHFNGLEVDIITHSLARRRKQIDNLLHFIL